MKSEDLNGIQKIALRNSEKNGDCCTFVDCPHFLQHLPYPTYGDI